MALSGVNGDHHFALYLQAQFAEEYLLLKKAGENCDQVAVELYIDSLRSLAHDGRVAANLAGSELDGLQAALDLQVDFDELRAREASDERFARRLAGQQQRVADEGLDQDPGAEIPTLMKMAMNTCAANRLNVRQAIEDGSISLITPFDTISLLTESHVSDEEDCEPAARPRPEYEDDNDEDCKPAATTLQDLVELKSASVPSSLEVKECSACYDTLPCYDLACDCFMCPECMANFIRTATNDPELLPLRCCNLEIDMGVAEQVLSMEEAALFQRRALEVLTPPDQMMYCSSQTCSQFILLSLVDTAETNGAFPCPACSESLCALCRNGSHVGEPCVTAASKRDNASDRQLVVLAEQEGWKKCPNCSHMIERKVGCNHMTCKCKQELCYSCGGVWGARGCPRGCVLFDYDQAEPIARARVIARVGRHAGRREVNNEVARMQNHENCEHRWRNRNADGTACTGCGWIPDVYINGCRDCHVQVCKTCKTHRYGWGR